MGYSLETGNYLLLYKQNKTHCTIMSLDIHGQTEPGSDQPDLDIDDPVHCREVGPDDL